MYTSELLCITLHHVPLQRLCVLACVPLLLTFSGAARYWYWYCLCYQWTSLVLTFCLGSRAVDTRRSTSCDRLCVQVEGSAMAIMGHSGQQ